MSCKTGAEHIKSLQDGRTVYLDGKLAGDVTVHPAFRNSVKSAAAHPAATASCRHSVT